jgi:hypothetical protein
MDTTQRTAARVSRPVWTTLNRMTTKRLREEYRTRVGSNAPSGWRKADLINYLLA